MYDLAVIGGGWAGFNAAIEAKKSGLNVVLIEKDKIGGTCLNRGCIPTKALIQSARVYSLSKKSAKFGVKTAVPQINFQDIQNRKQQIVSQLGKGMQFMLKGIDTANGQAQFLSTTELAAGETKIKAKHVLIATGSVPMQIPGLSFDGRKIISSNDILHLGHLPSSLLIIGGGVIGCEFASLFSALGTKITIAELMPQLLPQEDKEIARKLENIFKKRGININTGIDAKTLNLADYELVLLCIGRKPEFGSLDLQKIGVRSENGAIATNEYLSTSVANISAAGDCTGKKMLAHFAAHQGITAVKNILKGGQITPTSPGLIPNCIFTDPEIASIGINQQEAENKGIGIKITKFDFLGSGMAHIMDETEGFIKILAGKDNNDILGASIIGPKACELIGIFTIALQSGIKLAQLKNIIFAHPTLSESIHAAANS